MEIPSKAKTSSRWMGLVALVVLGLALVTVFMGVKAVPQGREYTVERFGRYTRTLEPGLHLIAPFVESVGAR